MGSSLQSTWGKLLAAEGRIMGQEASTLTKSSSSSSVSSSSSSTRSWNSGGRNRNNIPPNVPLPVFGCYDSKGRSSSSTSWNDGQDKARTRSGKWSESSAIKYNIYLRLM